MTLRVRLSHGLRAQADPGLMDRAADSMRRTLAMT